MQDLKEIREYLLSKQITMTEDFCLDNVEMCIRDTIKNGIEGDFIETGVWRGGICIYAWQVYKSLGVERKIFVADSFEGLPRPSPELYPMDKNDDHYTVGELKVSLEEVKKNFEIFEPLTDNLIFLKGWFKDTISTAPIDKLAVLRLDGDMYESTIQVLEALYPKLSVGGYCIIDDYGHNGCKAAVTDYRDKYAIKEDIICMTPRDHKAWPYPYSYWQKSGPY